GEWHKARNSLDHVLADTSVPQGPALALRGLVALEENAPAEAATWLDKAEAVAPFHPDVIDARTVVATRQGDKQRITNYQERKKKYLERAGQISTLYQKLNAVRRHPLATPQQRAEIAFELGTT